VPGNVTSLSHFWTFLTAGLYDTSFVMGLVNILVFLAVAPVLEKSWGTNNFVRFVLIVNFCSLLSVFVFMVTCFYFTEQEQFVYHWQVCGFSAVNAAYAVALKQRYPDRPLLSLPALNSIKIKHVPVIVVVLAVALWCAGRLGGKESPLVVFGTFFGWLYLRFYMEDQDTKVVGDLRDEFAFSTLFPDIFNLRSIIDFIGTVCYHLCLRVGCCQASAQRRAQRSTEADLEAGLLKAEENDPAFFRPVDPNAERRRALAIKAIDEKLAELAKEANFPAGVEAAAFPDSSHEALLAAHPNISAPTATAAP